MSVESAWRAWYGAVWVEPRRGTAALMVQENHNLHVDLWVAERIAGRHPRWLVPTWAVVASDIPT